MFAFTDRVMFLRSIHLINDILAVDQGMLDRVVWGGACTYMRHGFYLICNDIGFSLT